MARTKEFDPADVLEQAMELFWQQGYEATSMTDLVERLGIGRASLYATFGSKHDLYLAALKRYLEQRELVLVEALSQPGPVLPMLEAFVNDWVEEAVTDPARRGCFVVNAAVELSVRDETVAHQVSLSWRVLEAALTSALQRARSQGELPEGKEPRSLAQFLFVTLQGIRVIARAPADPARLHAAAAEALDALVSVGSLDRTQRD